MTNYTAIHYKILGLLKTMDAMFSTAGAIAGFLNLSIVQVENAIAQLTKDGMIATRKNEIFLTQEGADTFIGAVKRSGLEQSDYHQFVREALSGTDKDGKQSTITNAALPSNKRQQRGNASSTAHDNMIDLARKLKLETDQVKQMVLEGRIKECKKCKQIEIHQFARKNVVNTPCNKCRAKRLAERRTGNE